MDNFPLSLPQSKKLIWRYRDCFSEYPATKLCIAFLHENYNMDMHAHEFYEINIVVNGEGFHYSNNQRTMVKRGDIFIIPPKTLHGYYSIKNLNVYHALFQDLFFDRYFKDLELVSSYNILFKLPNKGNSTQDFHIKCHDENEIAKIEDAITKLKNSSTTFASFEVHSTDFIKSYINGLNLIISICDLYSKEKHNENEELDVNNNLVYKSIEYIHANYANKIDVNQLCKIAAMSRTPFFKKFQETTGQTPNEFINNYRLKIANKLILETDYSIGTISMMSGFYDSSHFIKAYRKQYGASPLKNRPSK